MIEADCHCGAVRMTLAHPPVTLTDCNCSICRRLGGLWAYYAPSEVSFIAGPEATMAYVHGDRTLALHHCRTCGCTTHWRSLDPAHDDRMGVNARLMDPRVVAAARIRKLDGADTWKFLDED